MHAISLSLSRSLADEQRGQAATLARGQGWDGVAAALEGSGILPEVATSRLPCHAFPFLSFGVRCFQKILCNSEDYVHDSFVFVCG